MSVKALDQYECDFCHARGEGPTTTVPRGEWPEGWKSWHMCEATPHNESPVSIYHSCAKCSSRIYDKMQPIRKAIGFLKGWRRP